MTHKMLHRFIVYASDSYEDKNSASTHCVMQRLLLGARNTIGGTISATRNPNQMVFFFSSNDILFHTTWPREQRRKANKKKYETEHQIIGTTEQNVNEERMINAIQKQFEILDGGRRFSSFAYYRCCVTYFSVGRSPTGCKIVFIYIVDAPMPDAIEMFQTSSSPSLSPSSIRDILNGHATVGAYKRE